MIVTQVEVIQHELWCMLARQGGGAYSYSMNTGGGAYSYSMNSVWMCPTALPCWHTSKLKAACCHSARMPQSHWLSQHICFNVNGLELTLCGCANPFHNHAAQCCLIAKMTRHKNTQLCIQLAFSSVTTKSLKSDTFHYPASLRQEEPRQPSCRKGQETFTTWDFQTHHASKPTASCLILLISIWKLSQKSS